jgi:predicted 3-demethylubiquinone-9 3-methyltransferase (glyoxalase superfamily)
VILARTDEYPPACGLNSAGKQVQGLNGGPDFKLNEAVSFVIECDNQAEVDRL